MKRNKSAIKRAKQSEEKRKRNAQIKSRMKTEIKKVLDGISTKNSDQVIENFRNAVKHIYKATSKGVIHKNKAARKVSRLSKRIQNSLKSNV